MQRRVYQCVKSSIRSIHLHSEELGAPAPDEVQVAVRAIGLNFADIFAILGLYEAAPRRPFIPGLEFAGEIVAIGSAVSDFRVGERVMGVRRFGAYTTALNVSAKLVRTLPADWTFEEGAGHLVASLTAYYALVDQAHLRQGETVLIESAAGGVGLAALAIAKKYRCFTIGAVGSEAKKDFCRARGYDRVITRRRFAEQLRSALGERELTVVLDAIGGRVFEESFVALASRGRMVVYGFAHFMPRNLLSYGGMLWRYLTRPKIDPLYLRNRSVSGFNLIHLFDKADELAYLSDGIERLDIGKPYIGRTYSFEEMPDALAALRSGETVGKIIVRV